MGSDPRGLTPSPVPATGILLVGGASERFGSPKALALFRGETLAERAWRVLGETCEEVLAVGKQESDGLALPFPVSDDGAHERAPVFGLIAGLRAASHEACVALPVDCPLVTPQLLHDLLDAGAVPQTGPLPGAYPKALLPELESRVAAGELSLRGVNRNELEVDERLVRNVNTRVDLVRAEADALDLDDHDSPSTGAFGQRELAELTGDFWSHAIWAARLLRRGEVFRSLECLDGPMKARLVSLLARHARAVDPSVEAWDSGRFLERWADPGALSALERAFAHYDVRDVARALWETIDLFQLLEEETARRLGLAGGARPRRASPARRGRRPRSAAGSDAVIVRGLLTAALALVVIGCGGHDEATTPVRVYFLRDGKVWPVAREVDATDPLNGAFQALSAGPTTAEQRDLGLRTAVPETQEVPLPRHGLAQLVYTSTQFAPHSADINGVHYTRADFEAQTPQILVESPLPFEEVKTPLRVTGTANTFEATFEYELKDSQGKVVDSNFVTATSGTGTRGTFDFTTKAVDDVVSLVVFERSAKDGSRINEVEIPLRPAS